MMLENTKYIYISFQLHLTVIDGNVLNALTGTTSTQVCPICGATSDFLGNKKFMYAKFLPIMNHLNLSCMQDYKYMKKWRISEENDKKQLLQS